MAVGGGTTAGMFQGAAVLARVKRQSRRTGAFSFAKNAPYSKVFGIKTFMKRFLSLNDAHLHPWIENILEILKTILSFGEISKDTKSRMFTHKLGSYFSAKYSNI